MSKFLGMISAGICSLSLTASTSAMGQEGMQFVPPLAKSHLASYAECARKHLEREAKKDPNTTFARIERSLRPACGLEIERARDALFRTDFSRAEANAIIRAAYASMQPEFRSLFNKAASAEKTRPQSEQPQTTRPQTENDAISPDERSALEIERTKFLNEASNIYDRCLISEIKNLLPVSDEPAETLTKVVEIKCGDSEKRVLGLGFALYGLSKAEFKTIVKDPLEERKKRLIADVVTLRADLAKQAGKPLKQIPEAGAGSNPNTGNPAPLNQH